MGGEDMAVGKIIAGDFSKDNVIKIVAGKPAIVPKDGGLFSKVNFINNDIKSIEIITEENKKKFIGTAGWGLVGGLALGPLGLIAGILAGGNKKEILIACELKDGKKLIAEVDSKIYKSMLTASY
jgi:hypothetical protein